MTLDDLCQRCRHRDYIPRLHQHAFSFDCTDRRIMNKRRNGRWAMRNCSKFVPMTRDSRAHRIIQTNMFWVGYFIRRVFGYGVMDEALGGFAGGMRTAEREEEAASREAGP